MRKRAVTCSPQVTSRLSVYLRLLTRLENDGVETISSRALADELQLKPSQIRKDLAYFGGFGTRGVGYRVAELRRALRRILGVNRTIGLIVVGAGRLGRALADYPGFNREGLEIVALFDVDPAKVGERVRADVSVHHLDRLEEVCASLAPEIAIVAVPPAAARMVAREVVRVGIRAILNFAPVGLDVPPGVKVNDVDLKSEIDTLSFFLKRMHSEQEWNEPAAVSDPSGRLAADLTLPTG